MDLSKVTNWTPAGSDAHKKSYPIFKGSIDQTIDLPNGDTMTVSIDLFKANVTIGETDHEIVEKTYNAAFDAIKALRAEYREERGLTGTSARDRFANRLAVIVKKIEAFGQTFDLPENATEKLEAAYRAMLDFEAEAVAAFDAGNVDRAEKAKTGTDE